MTPYFFETKLTDITMTSIYSNISRNIFDYLINNYYQQFSKTDKTLLASTALIRDKQSILITLFDLGIAPLISDLRGGTAGFDRLPILKKMLDNDMISPEEANMLFMSYYKYSTYDKLMKLLLDYSIRLGWPILNREEFQLVIIFTNKYIKYY